MDDSTQTKGEFSLERVAAWSERLAAFGLVSEERRSALDKAIQNSLCGGLGKPHEPLLTILLLGPTQVGKSQLLNALAGEEIAVSGDAPPTTRRPMVYLHEDARPEHLFEYGTTLGEMAESSIYRRVHRSSGLREKILIDAPDIDSYCTEHRERVLRLMPAVDVVLYVVSPQKYRDDVGWRLVLRERGRRAFAFVLNKWDQRKTSASGPYGKDIDQDFRELLESGGYSKPLLFRVSAKRWLERSLNPEKEIDIPKGDQFPALCDWLSRGLTTSKGEIIQRRRRRALWGDLAEQISKSIPQLSPTGSWAEGTLVALEQLRNEGIQTIRVQGLRTAQIQILNAGTRRWPRSPGILGLYLEGVTALHSLSNAAAHLHSPLRLWNPSQKRLTDSTAGADDSTGAAITTQLSARAQDWVSRSEASAGSSRVPADWVLTRIRQHLSALPAGLDGCLNHALSEPRQHSRRSIRYRAGVCLLAALELLLVTCTVVAVGRLATAFFTGHYVGLAFAWNALALLVGLLLCGHVVANCCFPAPEIMAAGLVRSELTACWNAWVGEAKGTVDAFMAELKNMASAGTQFSRDIDQQIQSCSCADSSLADQSDEEISNLFPLDLRNQGATGKQG